MRAPPTPEAPKMMRKYYVIARTVSIPVPDDHPATVDL